MANVNSFYLYQKYEKRGDQPWIAVYPSVYSVDGDGTMPVVVKQLNDPNCSETIYRTITSDTFYCGGDFGYDKYVDVYTQSSSNGGEIWRTIETTPILVEENSRDCGFVPHNYSQEYLTTTALEDGNISWYYGSGGKSMKMYYSLDNGVTWNGGGTNVGVNVSSGDTVIWKGENTAGRFSSTCSFKVSGNPTSVKYNDNFSGQTDSGGFDELFRFCTKLTEAYNLVLPSDSCSCSQMFEGCTSLFAAPKELPAASGVYSYMFEGCTSLRIVPSVLPQTTIFGSCYEKMFKDCTSLVTAPQIAADNIRNASYDKFSAQRCCESMFEGCTSLITPPAELKPQDLSNTAYKNMFKGCTSLTTAPVLSATTLASNCYYGMFNGCTSLSAITCLATDISASNCTTSWVDGVAANGTFIKAASMGDWSTGVNGIPSGWTVEDYSE